MIEILGNKYLSSKEACSLFGHSKSWLDKLRANNEGPPYIQINGKGKIYYELSKIEEWLIKHTSEIDK